MALVYHKAVPTHPVPQRALDAIAADAHLPICATCGTQYSSKIEGICPCCADERQWSPATGQEWTSLAELATHTHALQVDSEDARIEFIEASPPFAINQTRHYIWDCHAPFTPALAGYLAALNPPLKAIAISHPHFFSTSLVWARALRVPLYLCAADREWYARASDVTASDDVRFWTGRADLGPGVTLVQCGGHFPGSSVLYWDRGAEPDAAPAEPAPATGNPSTKKGLLLVSDTMMVCADRRGFTFMWSYPNMIPLRPADAVAVVAAVDGLEYGAACSTWPNRMIRTNAKATVHASLARYLDATGWELDGGVRGALRPRAK